MLNLIVLVTWMAVGIAIAAALAPQGEPRWSWMPLAAIFGPLWVSTALDQRGAPRPR